MFDESSSALHVAAGERVRITAAEDSELTVYGSANRAPFASRFYGPEDVPNEHRGKGYSNVMYIGSTVGCEKNWAYVERQKLKFLEGRTPPNFAPDDFEVDFVGRATVDDLTPLGKVQLGLLPH